MTLMGGVVMFFVPALIWRTVIAMLIQSIQAKT
jgi:hypothetical protein